jgi:hypothetical protein
MEKTSDQKRRITDDSKAFKVSKVHGFMFSAETLVK